MVAPLEQRRASVGNLLHLRVGGQHYLGVAVEHEPSGRGEGWSSARWLWLQHERWLRRGKSESVKRRYTRWVVGTRELETRGMDKMEWMEQMDGLNC